MRTALLLNLFLLCAIGNAEELQPFVAANGEWGFCHASFEENLPSPFEYALRDRTVAIPAQFVWVGYFRDGVARVTRTGRKCQTFLELCDAKWGWINERGEEVIPCSFLYASDFIRGLARVGDGKKWGAIERTGKLAVPMEYDYIGDVTDDRLCVANGRAYGFVDRAGQVSVPLKYDSAREFKEERAVVSKDKKVGWVDPDGREIAIGQFEAAHDFSEGLAAIQLNGKWGYSDRSGKVTIPARFERAERFVMGLAAVQENEKFGYIDTDGHAVIAPQFAEANEFSAVGLARVKIGAEYAFIRRNGEFAFPQRFSSAGDMYEGSAPVVLNQQPYKLGEDGSLTVYKAFGQFCCSAPIYKTFPDGSSAIEQMLMGGWREKFSATGRPR